MNVAPQRDEAINVLKSLKDGHARILALIRPTHSLGITTPLGAGQFGEGADDFGRGLDKFDQDALTRDGEFFVALGVQKTDVKTASTVAYAAWGKAYALGSEPLDGLGEVVDPKTYVVERGLVNRWLFVGIQGLHQVDFDAQGATANRANVLINVLTLAAKGTDDIEAEHVDPEFLQAGLVGSTNRDLLNAQDFEWPLTHYEISSSKLGFHNWGLTPINGWFGATKFHSNSTMTWSTESDSPLWRRHS
jgi:hypothetical protein